MSTDKSHTSMITDKCCLCSKETTGASVSWDPVLKGYLCGDCYRERRLESIAEEANSK